MKTHPSPSLTLAQTFEQFLEVSSFARRTRESYTEDLAPLFAECGQMPVTGLTSDVVRAFLARRWDSPRYVPGDARVSHVGTALRDASQSPFASAG